MADAAGYLAMTPDEHERAAAELIAADVGPAVRTMSLSEAQTHLLFAITKRLAQAKEEHRG